MQTITAIIPAKNEEKNIEKCIKSLSWCDSVIVLFSGNDNTATLAKKIGAKVISYEFKQENSFKDLQIYFNEAIKNAKTDWILRVDADEVVTPELEKDVKAILTHGTMKSAFGIPRKQYFFGTFLKGGDWAYDRLVRLFKKDSALYHPIVEVHEQLTVTGEIGYLQSTLLHYSHPTLDVLLDKFNSYTTLETKELKFSYNEAVWKMFFNPPYIFLRWFFWHHGYRDGLAGLLAGMYRGLYDFFLYSKYIEYKFRKNK